VIQSFLSYLHSNVTPGEAGSLPWVVINVLLVLLWISVGVIFMNWFERKVMARMQVRLGPMRVGPMGLLQPVADAIKLLLKEDLVPTEADTLVFWFAPIWVVMTAFCSFIVVPFGRTHAITDMNIGVLFMLGLSSLGVLGVIMAGWASNSHYPLLGSLRSGAQMVSYEVAMGMSVISAVMMSSMATGTGTLSMIGIVEAQLHQHRWFAFSFFPLGLIAMGVFSIAMVAETNRAPFDLPEAETELVAGYHTEYSAMKFAMFFMAEYANMITVASLATLLFLGGWSGPLFGPPLLQTILPTFWFVAKVFVFLFIYIWVRGTLPRFRYDQLMAFGWKFLLPLAIANLVITALVVALKS
jgi:NADH-quinone oxidoreductase subunit H